MDGLNRGTRARVDEFAELIAGGLILWRLSTAGQSDVWCLVFGHPTGLCFVLDDDPEGTRPHKVFEAHTDIVALLDRSKVLKDSLLQDGWTEIDVE
jgi:hypothetical protein